MISDELILMSIYVAESINQSIVTEHRKFQPRRPSSTAHQTVLHAVDVAKHPTISCY